MNWDKRENQTGGGEGWVFNIQHFSIHDGPGIRSTVFLMGCPLRCLWCHNPEGRDSRRFVGFDLQKCRNCGACVRVCPHGCHKSEVTHVFDRDSCILCGRCVEACVYGALYWVGECKSVEAVLAEIVTDKPYFDKSGGGVTLSGGEPAMQPEFAAALMRALHGRGIHTAVETCGYGPRSAFEKLLVHGDLFLFDCKETDPALHRKYTGVDWEPILENLFFLHERGANIILRCPIIPGLNDRQTHFEGIAALAGQFPGIQGVELLAYHSLGAGKSHRMGLPTQEQYAVPPKDMLEQWNERLLRLGCRVIRR
ncbi:MAG: glycyl-radical enzyme activating protein [Candidatus Pelethousia sp.]|nr:glycyl-radical enzyme activating protein [Candidatus Pelethousia sp.]